MKLIKMHSVVVLSVLINCVSCDDRPEHDFDENYEETTVKIVTVETTTQLVIIITDIPQADVDAALNLDVGEYTTQVFNYMNFGFSNINKRENCFQQYIKCVLTQGVSTPVCAVNDPFEIPDGYVTYDSVCELYLDNCRRLLHFWRLLDVGKCVHYTEVHATVEQTKRKYGVERPWQFIFYVLGSEDQSSKFLPK